MALFATRNVAKVCSIIKSEWQLNQSEYFVMYANDINIGGLTNYIIYQR